MPVYYRRQITPGPIGGAFVFIMVLGGLCLVYSAVFIGVLVIALCITIGAVLGHIRREKIERRRNESLPGDSDS